ncbi:MBL fold metallo-hydrolase [Tistrella mobilis]|nr:MBL fold metallo-hydrolase [Tistrella mobilis]KYO50410.1 MBL fold metallo-hydrolase [Tistrella mobilis]
MTFSVAFWGVRGSIACPTPRHMRYGGNTSCVAVTCGDRQLIFDAGTGIRELGHHMNLAGVRTATLLLSHTHWDHIVGFPFFSPAFRRGNRFEVLAGHLIASGGIRRVIDRQMQAPTFPVPLEAMNAEMTFDDFAAGDTLMLGPDIRVRTLPLNHPDGATGYRIDHAGRSVAYITDTEHRPDGPDQNVLALMDGVDLAIYDSTYTDDEYPAKAGWGHSTWQEGVRLARMAGARRLAIFHHDPDHEDDFMDRVGAAAAVMWPGAFIAREGLVVDLLTDSFHDLPR